MVPLQAHAFPRVGLLGNPSDLYGGRVIAFPFTDFRAIVRIEPAPLIALGSPGRHEVVFSGWRELVQGLRPGAYGGGVELLAAATAQLLGSDKLAKVAADAPGARFRMTFTTDVPRQVGLAGSSAIVVAALRALGEWFQVELTPYDVSELALRAETDELGIVAGPQDRVVQAYARPLHMDFTVARRPQAYTEIDPAWLPPLLVAWDPRAGGESGAVHDVVRQRWLAGDQKVHATMREIAGLALDGLRSLRSGDSRRLRALVDRNFDLRASVFEISVRDQEMVALGRRHRAGVKLCGSGGAVVCVVDDGDGLAQLSAAYRSAGFSCLRPRLTW